MHYFSNRLKILIQLNFLTVLNCFYVTLLNEVK